MLLAVEMYLEGDAVIFLIFMACVIGGALAFGIANLFYKDATTDAGKAREEKRRDGLKGILFTVFAIITFIILMMLFNTPANAPEEEVDPYGIPGATESAPIG